MFTDSPLRIAILAATLALTSGPAQAQTVEQPDSWQDHEQIDARMGVLQGPVWQPVWFTREDAPGRPAIAPIYKQQPPGAQEDFRPRPEPVVVTPVTTRPGPRPDRVPEPEENNDSKSDSDPDPDPFPCIPVAPCF